MKLNKTTGKVIWKKNIPANVPNVQSYCTEIQPLSDGGFIVNNSTLGCCRINSSGKVIKTRDDPNRLRLPENATYPPSQVTHLQVKQGSPTPNDVGNPNISDLIFISQGSLLYCLDANLNQVWRVSAGNLIAHYNNQIYTANESANGAIRIYNATTGDFVNQLDLFLADGITRPNIWLQDVNANGILAITSFTGGGGYAYWSLSGGAAITQADHTVDINAPIRWAGDNYIQHLTNTLVVQAAGSSFASTITNPDQFRLGYDEGQQGNPGSTVGGICRVLQTLQADNTGAIIACGNFGWLPIHDDPAETLDTQREYKNVWCFEPTGELRWSHAQTDEHSMPFGIPGIQGALINTGGTMYQKAGVAIGAKDGHPVVTSLMFPKRYSWRSKMLIDFQMVGGFH